MAENEPEKSKPLGNIVESQAELDPVVLPSNVTLYANQLGIGMTAFDIAVTFGEVVGIKDGRTVIQQRIKVLMSPLLAKIAANSIAQSVAQYEERFGEIKEPKEAGAVVEKG
jgi:hypothetical protein